MTHDYKRNRTIDPFATMNVATGRVLTGTQKRHAAADVVRFFKQIDAGVPEAWPGISCSTNSPHTQRPKSPSGSRTGTGAAGHLHLTPSSSSWMNLIECRFKGLTDKRLRRCRFTNAAELTEAITTWAEHCSPDPKAFIWKATADDLIAKVQARPRHSTR